MSHSDTLFSALKSHVVKVKPAVRQAKDPPWISESTWRSMDSLTSLQWETQTDRARIKLLHQQQVRTSIREDQKIRMAKPVRSLSRSHVNKGELKTALDELKVFYREISDQPPKPSRIKLGRVTAEDAALYARQEDLPEETIPVLVAPVDIPNNPLTHKETAFVVRGLWNWQALGPSGMLAEEHLKAWLVLATEPPEGTAACWDSTAWECSAHLFGIFMPPAKCQSKSTIMGNHVTAPKGGGTV